jgi:hypothetical protein
VGKVRLYALPSFYEEEWGGLRMREKLLIEGNTDASKQFWKYHNEGVLKKYQGKLKVGELKEEAKL